jgi:hypothetical protein
MRVPLGALHYVSAAKQTGSQSNPIHAAESGFKITFFLITSAQKSAPNSKLFLDTRLIFSCFELGIDFFTTKFFFVRNACPVAIFITCICQLISFGVKLLSRLIALKKPDL